MGQQYEGRTILLVEDERIVAMAQKSSLEGLGYRVRCAYSGEEAVALAVGDDRPDLILMDIDLGDGMDGTDAARMILSRREIPIVFLTGHAERETVERVKGITRYGYVLKLSGEFVLQQSIAMAFELADAHRRLPATEGGADVRTVALEDAANGIVFTDLHGTIEYANAAVRTMWGYGEPEEVLGRPVYEFVDEGQPMREVFRAAVRDGRARAEFAARRRDGSVFPAEICISLVRGQDGLRDRAMGSILDISERKELEADLRQRLLRSQIVAAIADARAREASESELVGCCVGELAANLPHLRIARSQLGADGRLGQLDLGAEKDYLCAIGSGETFVAASADAGVRAAAAADHAVPGALVREGVCAMVHVPLPAGDGAPEVLRIESTRPMRFTAGEVQTFTEVGHHLRTAIAERRARRALASSEARYRHLAENVDDVIFRYQLRPERRALYVNAATTRVSGYTPQEYYDDPELVYRVVHPDDRYLLDLAAADPTLRERRLRIRWVRPDGGVRVTEQAYVPTIDRDGGVVVIEGIARDITEQERMKQALTQKTEELERFVGLVPVLVGTAATDGTITKVNDASNRILGYLPSEVVGRAFADFVHPDDLGIAADAVRALVAGEQMRSFVSRCCTEDGEERWLEWHALLGPDGLLYGAARDITARREAELALVEKERKLRNVIESARVGTWQWNLETGETEINDILARMLGISAEQAGSVSIRTWERLVHSDDYAPARSAFFRHLTGRSDDYDVEIRMRHQDGSWVWVRHRGRVMTRNGRGRPELMFGTYTNVTKRREAYARVEALLHEKETLLREVHHRIKNNMNTLAAIISLQASATSNAETIAALEEAHARLQSMTVLYDRLHHTGSVDAMPAADYLGSLVDEVLSLFPNRASVRVEKRITSRVLDTKTLATLGTVVNELLTNAMKHGFPAGREGTIQVSLADVDGGMILEVADDGIGVTQGARCEGGYGLKLVEILAEQLDGTLNMETDGRTRIVLTVRR